MKNAKVKFPTKKKNNYYVLKTKDTTTKDNKESKCLSVRDRVSKESPWLEDYLDCFVFNYKPVTQMFIERISKELVTWARTNEKAYKVRPFFSEKGIP